MMMCFFFLYYINVFVLVCQGQLTLAHLVSPKGKLQLWVLSQV